MNIAEPLVTNPYLEQNYKPVQEEVTALNLEVIGQIPADLEGNFLRIGPNPVFVPDVAKYHIFDGDGMIHGVHLRNGKADYRNRFVDSEGLREEREKGDWIYPGLNMFGEMIARGEMPSGAKNTGNTAMVVHKGQLFALMEGSTPYAISLPELKTLGEHDFDGTLTHNFTAHPKVDVKTGEMVTFGYSPLPPYLNYSVIDTHGKVVHHKEISIPKGIMMHDCAITESYTIFPDLPLVFDFEAAARGEGMIQWDADNGCRFGIVPRFGSDENIKWFDIPESFLFHISNAWEEGDEVVVQACRSNRGGIELTEGVEPTEQMGQLYEWRLNMATGEIKTRAIDTVNYCDFPRINDNLMGFKNRYLYASRFVVDGMGTFNAELKYDNDSGEIEVHEFGEHHFSSEAIFAPRTNAVDEDDGYVICFVYDELSESSECHIIDAKRFSEPAVARIKIPQRVPHGFHAAWAPG
ncbi:MAG: carotenoid cleavage dioxygenase-like enzyme [Candidatus Azotimanducaceae bacterium]|jgi:carotenoid cleavage dioxygenase-like enzyme